MYRLTRAVTTLIAAGIAGIAIWVASQMNDRNQGGYWATVGLLAGAGLVMALSQLAGGWTRWGRPRISGSVLLIAFVPVAVVTLWIVLAGEPGSEWFHRHVSAWSGGHSRPLVRDGHARLRPGARLRDRLVLGFSFETAGPRPAEVVESAPDEQTELDAHEPDEAPSGEPERETTRVS